MANTEYSFQTLAETAEGIYTEKGSKFIAIAFPFSNETEFKKELKIIQSKYRGARHYCYAYIIGTGDDAIQRSNDDGEPSGTAGKPILNQLIASHITNAGIIVVRYFGGVLLGTSGLSKAYKYAAQEAIKNSKIIIVEKNVSIQITCNYEAYNELMQIIKKSRGSIDKQEASEKINLYIKIPLSEQEKFEKELLSLKVFYEFVKLNK